MIFVGKVNNLEYENLEKFNLELIFNLVGVWYMYGVCIVCVRVWCVCVCGVCVCVCVCVW